MNGIEIILIAAMVVLTIWILLRKSGKPRGKKAKDTPQTHHERAVWAWAKIVSSTHGAAGLAGMVRVALELEVHLPGTPQFPAATTWLVEQEMLTYVEIGKEVSLKVDPLDVKYIYPGGSWARLVE